MKITHKELILFWDEVLSAGDDWYIEEGAENWEGDEPDDALIEIQDYAYVNWGWGGEVKYAPLMQDMINRGTDPDSVFGLCELIEEWRKSHTTLYWSIEVPKDKEEQVKAALQALGVEVTLTRP